MCNFCPILLCFGDQREQSFSMAINFASVNKSFVEMSKYNFAFFPIISEAKAQISNSFYVNFTILKKFNLKNWFSMNFR